MRTGSVKPEPRSTSTRPNTSSAEADRKAAKFYDLAKTKYLPHAKSNDPAQKKVASDALSEIKEVYREQSQIIQDGGRKEAAAIAADEAKVARDLAFWQNVSL